MRSATVIPVTRLPRNLRQFDYAIPDELTDACLPGTFVAIPFRSSVLPGLVTALQNEVEQNLKPISRILPLRYESWNVQSAYCEWFACFYCISPATALKTLLPAFPASLLTRGTIRKTKSRTPPLHDACMKTERYAHHHPVIADTLRKKKNVLIFFPTIHDVQLFESRARELYGEDRVTVLHSGITPTLLFSRWAGLFEGEPRCILTTRTGAGIPLHNLGAIIIDSAEREEHNQYDLNPRFDVRVLARSMQKLTHCSLVFSSPTPRLEEYMLSPNSVSPYRPIINVSTGEDIVIVPMRDELRARGRGYISEELINLVCACMKTEKGAFLFLNRTGTSRMVSCRDCAQVLSCPSCARPFRAAASRLVCDRCDIRQTLPSRCPQCRSVRFHFIALGTEKIAELMRKEFPQASVVELTQQKHPDTLLAALHTTSRDPILAHTIIVGTSFLPYSCPEGFHRIGLIGVLAGDPLVTLSDFRSEERNVHTLFYLKQLAENAPAQLLVQTFSPDQPSITALRAGNYSIYAESARAERTAHGWPPATRLIRLRLACPRQVRRRLTCPRHIRQSTSPPLSSPRTRGSSEEMINHIAQKCIAHGATIRSKASDSILFTIPKSPHADTEIPDDLNAFLLSLPNEWLIDIDPVVM